MEGVHLSSPMMERALRLARRGRYTTSPNPMVGAVVTDKDGILVGEGYHKRPGGPHAEVGALAQAGSRAQGGTLYVTLEPCNHTGRTPPCTDAIISAGIAHVVIAMKDPNPEVKGGGIERLQASGITVTVGDGEAEAALLNKFFVTWSQQRRPFVTLKAAMSLDGKVATKTGDSKYITHAKALAFTHTLRRQHDAILVGVNTILADDPALTYRGQSPGSDPVRIVLDSHGRTPPDARIFSVSSTAPTLVFTTNQAPEPWQREIFSAGGEVIEVPADPHGTVDLAEVLHECAQRHLLSVLVEGGPTVHAAFIAAGLADEWYSFIGPLIIGGEAPTPVGGPGVSALSDAWQLRPLSIRRLGPDVLIHAQFLGRDVDLEGGLLHV
ncbi:MAG: bifunctional diaminohydroxyphosphoribosylaminopyrimidine deaminase/5-amino-6-(5-phosphoribosylamino)uracil reductase RibD [Sulfobacillus thermosulfidooxidans]|nr:MAG: bifunctional diaminohydroxyphosphoribosylaminopyrimidine deaminase/5-amino-6-(5-phosphoribosylamino)uracil reductase RibD [Sulfobacillus thermosulfidooxidans]